MATVVGPDYYAVLSAAQDSTPAEIKQAYKRSARHWHPDKAHASDKDVAERKFKEVSEAYTVLSDERQRHAYDLFLSCRAQGYVEVADPDRGGYHQVPFSDWREFNHVLEFADGRSASASSARRRKDDEDRERSRGADAGSDGDAPISVFEWLLAGGVVATLWCVAVGYHQRRVWLEALPEGIWRNHCEYAAPLGLLLSPFYFGNVPFRDAASWFSKAVKYADGY